VSVQTQESTMWPSTQIVVYEVVGILLRKGFVMGIVDKTLFLLRHGKDILIV
jgi:hypothetical protein